MADNFKKPQPLQDRVPIVNPDGTPNPYFIKWAQERQSAIAGSVSPAEAAQIADAEIAAWSALRNITGGTALTEVPAGGALSTDVVINHDNSAVTPGTYGDATHSPRLTIDQQGHVTSAVDVAISGGGGGSYTKLDQIVVTVAQTTIDFTSINQSFDDLILVVTVRGDNVSLNALMMMQFNGDTGANYDYSAYSFYGASGFVNNAVTATAGVLGYSSAASAPAGQAAVFEITIQDYSKTAFNKNYQTSNGQRQGTGSSDLGWTKGYGDWRNTAAINQVTLFLAAGNFDVGSAVTLYGRG